MLFVANDDSTLSMMVTLQSESGGQHSQDSEIGHTVQSCLAVHLKI